MCFNTRLTHRYIIIIIGTPLLIRLEGPKSKGQWCCFHFEEILTHLPIRSGDNQKFGTCSSIRWAYVRIIRNSIFISQSDLRLDERWKDHEVGSYHLSEYLHYNIHINYHVCSYIGRRRKRVYVYVYLIHYLLHSKDYFFYEYLLPCSWLFYYNCGDEHFIHLVNCLL